MFQTNSNDDGFVVILRLNDAPDKWSTISEVIPFQSKPFESVGGCSVQ